MTKLRFSQALFRCFSLGWPWQYNSKYAQLRHTRVTVHRPSVSLRIPIVVATRLTRIKRSSPVSGRLPSPENLASAALQGEQRRWGSRRSTVTERCHSPPAVLK